MEQVYSLHPMRARMSHGKDISIEAKQDAVLPLAVVGVKNLETNVVSKVVTNDRVRIPGDADQRSELMAITIPTGSRSLSRRPRKGDRHLGIDF